MWIYNSIQTNFDLDIHQINADHDDNLYFQRTCLLVLSLDQTFIKTLNYGPALILSLFKMGFTLYQPWGSRSNIIRQQAGDAYSYGHCPVTYECTKPQYIIRIHAVLHWEMTKISRWKAADHTRILLSCMTKDIFTLLCARRLDKDIPKRIKDIFRYWKGNRHYFGGVFRRYQ